MSERRKALITGSSRGIGAAAARMLARQGHRVAVHGRSAGAAARELLAGLDGDGHVLVTGDLRVADRARAVVDEAAEQLGGLDVLVNNAAVYARHAIMEADFDAWRAAWERTLAVDLLAPAHASWAAARHLGRGGRIVNVSSRGAFRGEPDHPAYGAAKAGLNQLGQSLAVALAPRGIAVMTVAPGFVETEMAVPLLAGEAGDAIRGQSPFGRVADAEEVARVIAFLALEAPEFMSGCVVDVNGASYLRT